MIHAEFCRSFVALTHDFPVFFDSAEPETRGGNGKNRRGCAVLVHIFHVSREYPCTRAAGRCSTAGCATILTATAAVATLAARCAATTSRCCETAAASFRMCPLIREVDFGSEVMVNVDPPRIVTAGLCT